VRILGASAGSAAGSRAIAAPTASRFAPRALVVESRADVFPSAGAARRTSRAYEQEYEAQPPRSGVARLDAPELGEGAVAFRFGSGLDRFVLVAWRNANATASLLVEGSSVTLPDAVAWRGGSRPDRDGCRLIVRRRTAARDVLHRRLVAAAPRARTAKSSEQRSNPSGNGPRPAVMAPPLLACAQR